ncbi:putative vacuolar protein sorting-associated protein vps5 [Dioszegia hungarica]|uniref:Vacuolar protein sorting-associated protein vps5 n=1 Tax=Dioszegia hungarica TaxID=4972 RepID=A0AA38H968_9TREE|nr:putative vacuolar protein sorting-associated protein vps5 [Dioszegia hungarica]KAI9634689.1 putative vacuolar protein sorting-associated protein vps5 [Dioszegia hungarica]
MDADEERDFAALLSQSTALPTRPTWSPQTSATTAAQLDPWANPFASSPTDPFSAPAATSTALPSFTSGANGGPSGSGSGYVPPAASGFDDYSSTSGGFGETRFDYTPSPPTATYSGGAGIDAQQESDSPYVQKLEDEQMLPSSSGGIPEPPSVIAARERDGMSWGETDMSGFGAPAVSTSSWDPSADQYQVSPPRPSQAEPVPPHKPTPPQTAGRILPSDLIDEDLMAASDPSISLKRAFVKSTPAAPAATKGKTPEKAKQGAYVFRPAGVPVKFRGQAEEKKGEAKAPEAKVVQEAKKVEEDGTAPVVEEVQPPGDAAAAETVEEAEAGASVAPEDKPAADVKGEILPADQGKEVAAQEPESARAAAPSPEPAPPKVEPKAEPSSSAVELNTSDDSKSVRPTPSSPPLAPASIPLPASSVPTRTSTPLPPSHIAPTSPSPPLYPTQTPTHDRVAVSPLEPPSAHISDFGFKSLSIGAAGMMPPPAAAEEGWGGGGSGIGSRFGGKGWGAMDAAPEEEGLFGKGGPVGDPWGGGGGGGWGGEADAGPSSPPVQTEPEPSVATPKPTPSPGKPRRRTFPVFTISISDPARVGDPVRGYTVYTLRTHTTSPHYRKSDFTALRRFSDFLWLFDSLIANNPGIIVPPVPDKHTFGRFQEQFIETRRLALERSLNKIAAHPVLQLDPDLRLFLEADNFGVEIRGRGPVQPVDVPAKSGLLGGWNTPKFIESDDWFTSRMAFLDGLEVQLKALSKSVELASRARLDMATSQAEVADALQALAESDLGSAMCASLAQMADLARREKEGAEELAKGDVVNLLNMADEYVRFVGSVRRAMGGRTRVWLAWQALEREVARLKGVREKARVQGKLGDRAAQTLADINDVDRKARASQQEYETLTKLVKSEFGRFERERVDEFKRVLEKYLDDQMDRQREMIMSWEEYHVGVLGMVRKAQGIKQAA